MKEAEHVLAELKDCAFLTVIKPSLWNEKVDLRCSCSGVFHLIRFVASLKEAEHVLEELKDCAFLTVT